MRMVFDHQAEYPSQWKAIESISAKLSINHETLRQWVRHDRHRRVLDSSVARGDASAPDLEGFSLSVVPFTLRSPTGR